MKYCIKKQLSVRFLAKWNSAYRRSGALGWGDLLMMQGKIPRKSVGIYVARWKTRLRSASTVNVGIFFE